MRLASRLNIRNWSLVTALGLIPGLWAQMPDGPGREETMQVCSSCHDLARSISVRQDRDGWKATINKMLSLGAEATEQQFSAVLEYLAANFRAEALPPLNVNKATAIELESRLTLKRSQSAAVIDYRTKHGNFKSIEDLKKVPGIDPAKIEEKKGVIVF